MPTALDDPFKLLDESEQKFVTNIRDQGWSRTTVLEDEEGPGFSYSTGIWISADQPELIMFGMSTEIVHDVFWDLFREAEANNSLPVGKRTDAAFANLPAYAFAVAEKYYPSHLGWSRWFYKGDNFPCLQIVWPDRQGVFPWETGFDAEFEGVQPDLTEAGWAAAIVD